MSMQLKPLNDKLHVSAQLTPANMAEAAASGFALVICNRPDGEDPGQPAFAAVKDAATAAGLDTLYLPIVPGRMTLDDVARFSAAIDAAKGPVLAYCRTGNRCTQLWMAGRA